MMNGGDLYELAKLLGHANIKMTERYAKLGRAHITKTGNTANNGQRVLGKNGSATGGYLVYMRSQDYDGSTKDLGTITPTLLWGTVQTFDYKNFSLSFQIDSKVGGLMASATDQYGSTTGSLKSSLPGRNAALGGVTYVDANGIEIYDYFDHQLDAREAMPTDEVAFAVTACVPKTNPADGLVMLMAGAGFATVTVLVEVDV